MAIKNNPLAYAILGCAMKVHRTLGYGFLEAVYADALEIELSAAEIPFEREKEIRVSYNGRTLKSAYRADFVCCENFIVELKAIKSLSNIEKAQTLNYVKATDAPAALLINFGAPSLQYEYLTPQIWNNEKKGNSDSTNSAR